MKKALLLTGALLALTAPIASAAGISLAWSSSTAINDCPGAGLGPLDMTNTCNSNAGAVVLIGSIVSPGLQNVVGQAIIIDMQESGVVALSDWWNFDVGACRGKIGAVTASLSLGASFDPLLDDGFCGNLWQASDASGATSYQPNFPSNGRAHITGAFAVAVGQPWPAGTEWYSFRMVIDKRHTVAGTLPVCAGCQDGACFTFQYAQVNQPAGTPGGDATLETPAGRGQSVSYRGGGALNCALATPARRATWGQVKSLYR